MGIWTLTAMAGLLASSPVTAQASNDPAISSQKPRDAPLPAGPRVRVQFLLNRSRGEKKIASRPYSVLLQPGEEQAASLFSGSQVPLRTSYQGQATVMLKEVGVKTTCAARLFPDGRYRLDVSFDDGSLSGPQGEKDNGRATIKGDYTPVWRVFNGQGRLFVRDGETVPLISAIDPETADTVEVAISLNVLK